MTGIGNEILTVAIGYDSREDDAWEVCRRSLVRHSNIPLEVRKLHLYGLQQAGIYTRTFHREGNQCIDDIDGLPFSTQFSFSRFLVPALQNWRGWAVFVDCDFLFLGDIGELAAWADDSKAVQVCKQNHQPANACKMDGQAQTRYARKNWSSLMLFNCAHPANRALTPQAVNTKPGRWLHGFQWLSDDLIGELPPQWNYIDGITFGEPKAVHYTEGGPWFPAYQDCAYAAEWTREWRLWRHDLERERVPVWPRDLVA